MKKNNLFLFALLLSPLLSGAEAYFLQRGKFMGNSRSPPLPILSSGRSSSRTSPDGDSKSHRRKTDWSDCRALAFDLYSIRSGKETFAITIHFPRTGNRGSYSLLKLPVNWTGWKTIVLPFHQFRTPGKADWKRVAALHHTPKGYGLTPQKGGVVYLRNIRLLPRKKETPAERLAVNLIPSIPRKAFFPPSGMPD